jgi:hypothetical protein
MRICRNNPEVKAGRLHRVCGICRLPGRVSVAALDDTFAILDHRRNRRIKPTVKIGKICQRELGQQPQAVDPGTEIAAQSNPWFE